MVPESLMAQSGLVAGVSDADTLVLLTVPLSEPPEVPSHVNVPESTEPLCVIVIVIGQPSMCSPLLFVQALLSLIHVPEASAIVGLVGVEQPDSTATAANSTRAAFRIMWKGPQAILSMPSRASTPSFRKKRPRDGNERAFQIVQESVGLAPPDPPEPPDTKGTRLLWR
jgi:hypothetical protein